MTGVRACSRLPATRRGDLGLVLILAIGCGNRPPSLIDSFASLNLLSRGSSPRVVNCNAR